MARRQGREREQYWQKVIRDQAASGLSISAFCRKHEVPEASFFAWRRKLGQRPEVSERWEANGRPSANELIDKPSAQFVSFELPSLPRAGRTGLEIVLPDGCRLLVGELCEANWLRQILAAVRERAC